VQRLDDQQGSRYAIEVGGGGAKQPARGED
jgi:hypothetical protein